MSRRINPKTVWTEDTENPGLYLPNRYPSDRFDSKGNRTYTTQKAGQPIDEDFVRKTRLFYRSGLDEIIKDTEGRTYTDQPSYPYLVGVLQIEAVQENRDLFLKICSTVIITENIMTILAEGVPVPNYFYHYLVDLVLGFAPEVVEEHNRGIFDGGQAVTMLAYDLWFLSQDPRVTVEEAQGLIKYGGPETRAKLLKNEGLPSEFRTLLALGTSSD